MRTQAGPPYAATPPTDTTGALAFFASSALRDGRTPRGKDAFILISAGYDAHERDPLARMRLSTSGYAFLTKSLCDVADAHCHGRIVAVTEGGYDLNALKSSLDASIAVLDGAPVPEPTDAPLPATSRSRLSIAAVRSAHSSYWKL